MNIIKSLFAVALFALGTTTVSAQEKAEYQFKPHAYLDLQGGAQYTLGETDFSDLLSPNFQLGLGYQISPVFGLRLAANGLQSKGAVALGGTQVYKYNYVAGGLDATFNLSNLICGWKPKRFFNVSAFVGGGVNYAYDNDEANEIGNPTLMKYLWDGSKVRPYGRAGLQIALRLSNYVSFLLEGNSNFISDKYNSKFGDNPDWYFNGLAGFRINLGAPYKKIATEAPVVESTYVEPEPEPEPAPVVEEKKIVEPTPVPVKVDPLRREIFFNINKTNILPSEAGKVKDIADYLNANPNAKVAITGYADAGTGNDRINDRLAKLRADSVVKALTQKYGIAADRITYDSKGAHVQPFAENDKNRVSICIAE